MYVRLRVSFPKLPRRYALDTQSLQQKSSGDFNFVSNSIPCKQRLYMKLKSNFISAFKTDRVSQNNNWNIPSPPFVDIWTKDPLAGRGCVA